eukprot:2323849-Rhodomonas_salina.1
MQDSLAKLREVFASTFGLRGSKLTKSVRMPGGAGPAAVKRKEGAERHQRDNRRAKEAQAGSPGGGEKEMEERRGGGETETRGGAKGAEATWRV